MAPTLAQLQEALALRTEITRLEAQLAAIFGASVPHRRGPQSSRPIRKMASQPARKPMSAAARKKLSDAMKARWAARRTGSRK